MGKVYAYLRVSTDSQNLMQQQNTINEYIKYKGLTITDVVTDEGVSGGVSYKDRHLYNLVQSLNEGDVIVVSEISRLGRSMSDLNKLVNEELKPRKIRLIIITMGLDLEGLRDANEYDFVHDVVGINHHLNRRNGELKDFFLPRYAK